MKLVINYEYPLPIPARVVYSELEVTLVPDHSDLQVETVFHEFGHALQHMLTKEDEGLVAGIRNIEWDAVELPSQFMENWCYHRYLGSTA